MIAIVRFALLAGALSLAACQQPSPDPSEEPSGSSAPSATAQPKGPPPVRPEPTASPKPAGADPAATGPLAGENDGYPDLTPAPLTPEVLRTAKGAMALALPWARGIELREFDQSWNLMGSDAKSKWSRTAFNALFQPLTDLFVEFGEGRMEGAAGSTFYSLPVTISGRAAQDGKRSMQGELVFRRTNDVPGATAEQLNWRIASLTLTAA